MPEETTKPRGYKTIKLPCNEEKHTELLMDTYAFRSYVDYQHKQHPELFPTDYQQGYELHGFTEPSKKNERSTDASH